MKLLINKILNKSFLCKIKSFEYLYLFIMVIYMAQMTTDTSRMFGGLSGNPIPFLLPIIMTCYLLKRNPISFTSKRLQLVLLIVTVWGVLLLIKVNKITTEELSYLFFLYYAILIAYIHIRVYDKNLFYIYEDIMVTLSKVSLILWGLTLLLPQFLYSIFHLFPSTFFGNNILFIYQSIDSMWWKDSYLLRNAGCSWEPGRFAIMVVLAILCNLSRKGIIFRGNKNAIYLLLTLLSTQSTTGLFVTIVLYAIFYVKHFSVRSVIGTIFIISPLVIGLFSLDFMGDKIKRQSNIADKKEQILISADYMNRTEEKGVYKTSLDRFPSMVFEWENLIHDPILGYGRNIENSYFRKNISTNMILTDGTVKQLAQFGIFLGLYFYYILFKSSIKYSEVANVKRRYALFLLVLLCGISYTIFCVPIFTAFWFYGYFKKDESLYNNERAVS